MTNKKYGSHEEFEKAVFPYLHEKKEEIKEKQKVSEFNSIYFKSV